MFKCRHLTWAANLPKSPKNISDRESINRCEVFKDMMQALRQVGPLWQRTKIESGDVDKAEGPDS